MGRLSEPDRGKPYVVETRELSEGTWAGVLMPDDEGRAVVTAVSSTEAKVIRMLLRKYDKQAS